MFMLGMLLLGTIVGPWKFFGSGLPYSLALEIDGAPLRTLVFVNVGLYGDSGDVTLGRRSPCTYDGSATPDGGCGIGGPPALYILLTELPRRLPGGAPADDPLLDRGAELIATK